MDANLEQRRRHLKRFASLLSHRQASFDPHWRDLANYIAPRRTRFFQGERSTSGRKKEMYIINSTATWALRTLSAGMMAGITSPVRKWFAMATQDPELAKRDDVREWLHEVAERIRGAMLKSNLYNALQVLYIDLCLFGTGAMFLDGDGPGALRAFPLPMGEYVLALSDRGVVDTMYRETSFTVSQLIKRFETKGAPLRFVSDRVKALYENGDYDTPIEVVHVVCPREEYDPSQLGPKNMPWSSCWMERKEDVTAGFLRESGYEVFPVIAPRWAVTSSADTYGYSPAMEILGDVKELQLVEKKKTLLAELLADPPLNVPASMVNSLVSLLPGATNYVPEAGNQNTVTPAMQVPPQGVSVLDGACRQFEGRIKEGMYANLWVGFMDAEEGQPITAQEVRARQEEKMLQLGPVLERLDDEALRPTVERYYHALDSAGQLPPPPQAIAGQPLRAEFSSIMNQAQKAVDAGGIQQLMSFVGNIAAVKPDVLDNVDTDEATREMADYLGASPKLVKSAEAVAAVRQQRAKQQAQQAATANALAASQAAKNLGQANMGGDTALSQVAAVAGAQGGGR